MYKMGIKNPLVSLIVQVYSYKCKRHFEKDWSDMIAEMTPVAMKEIRESRGMTKAQLARETKMQAGLIGWIESGRFIPYESQLKNIAKVLGVDDPESLLEQVV